MVEGIFGHPARIALLDDAVQERLVARIQSRGHDVPEDVFFFPLVASTDRMDSYFTRMAQSSLQNYAADISAGVAFQNSHRHGELPFGRSVEGEFDPSTLSTRGFFYTLRGLNLNGVGTDDLIRGIQSGIVSDVSIGFYGGEYICSECSRSLWDSECTHVPGLRYDDHIGFARVEDARLAEVSAVYEGATPGAAIIKAQREADAGRLRPEAAQIIEARYRIQLPGSRHAWAGAPTVEVKVDLDQELRAMLALDAEADVLEGVRTAMAGTNEKLDAANRKIAELEPLAADGKQYRADLITEALAEGVRAHGDGFNVDAYRGVLNGAPLDIVKRMRDDWKAVADKIFVGARASEDKPKVQEAPKAELPNRAAFKS